MNDQLIDDILNRLQSGSLSEYRVKKEEFLEFRTVLVKREDFKHFRGIAQHGGDFIYRYTAEARS